MSAILAQMRTTLNLDDDVARRAKIRAAERGRTFSALIEDALRLLLAQAEGGAAEDLGEDGLPVVRGGRVQAGVDLRDNSALMDLLDDEG